MHQTNVTVIKSCIKFLYNVSDEDQQIISMHTDERTNASELSANNSAIQPVERTNEIEERDQSRR
jgi:hypothetical protein